MQLTHRAGPATNRWPIWCGEKAHLWAFLLGSLGVARTADTGAVQEFCIQEWAAGPFFICAAGKRRYGNGWNGRKVAGSAERVQELIAPTVNALGVTLWGVEYLAQGRRSLLRIYIDREPGGVDVDDCERVSRQVSALLDVEDPIAGEYTLEVSSPGLDRPLFEAAQFACYAGHEVKLQLRMPLDGRRKFTGIIERVEDDAVIVVCDGEALTLPLTQIDRARLTY